MVCWRQSPDDHRSLAWPRRARLLPRLEKGVAPALAPCGRFASRRVLDLRFLDFRPLDQIESSNSNKTYFIVNILPLTPRSLDTFHTIPVLYIG